MGRLEQQVDFLVEIDKLKRVYRQSSVIHGDGSENSAEHSWHLGLFALVLCEYAPGVDMGKVLKMLLVHDIVEIDAGDTFIYDEDGQRDKARREQDAADRLFGLLPSAQATDLRSSWDEFEERVSAEARFAAALDRLQPLLHNHHNEGDTWQRHRVTSDRVYAANRHIADGAPRLWELARELIDDAVASGVLAQP